MNALAGQVQTWIDDEVDPADARELAALLESGSWDELAERFRAPLTFGTAGLRGPLRAGPNGMNRAVVRRAAAGLAAWLADDLRRPAERRDPVVVGYDGRRRSREFAYDSAAIIAAAGFEAVVLPRLLPTPVLAFAVRRLGAAAGVMVTASHNPAADNGYKVYAGDGAQIAPPTDLAVEAAIRAVGPTREIAMDPGRVTVLGEGVLDAYVSAVAGLVSRGADGPRDVRIVHTAMHGVASETINRVLAAAGFSDLVPVTEQQHPDPDFPTVAFPNPEEPGALDLAFSLAQRANAELIIANDPDADRCAVAVPWPSAAPAGAWRMLRGDEVGVLLADALLRKGARGTYATSLVSSTMLKTMAERSGVPYAETLTGFKWIARVPGMVYGYEEALGYAVAPELVLDKDGISAALLVAELAADLKLRGSSLPHRLEQLAAEYGRHVTDQVSVRVEDIGAIGAMTARLRAQPPARLLDSDVSVDDLLPDNDILCLTFTGGRVVVRPSGTEPKLKAYLEVVSDGPAAEAELLMAQLRTEVIAALGL